MKLDKHANVRILNHGNVNIANIEPRQRMTYGIVKTVSASEQVAVDDLLGRLLPCPLAVAREIRTLREEADQILQKKHLAGKILAHDAVAYLFGAVETHSIEFAVGDENVNRRAEQRGLQEGYAAHLDYLSSQGAIVIDNDGLHVAYGTGRALQRVESDHDIDGNPGVISYRDSDTQRALEITSNNPKRLFAGA